MYNFVSAEWLEVRYSMFPWDTRALRLYVEFLKRYMVPLTQPVVCDYQNGGFYMFRLLKEPLREPQPSVWFTPGAEGVYAKATAFMKMGKVHDALREYQEVHRLLPDSSHAWATLGHVHLTLENHKDGYAALKEFGSKGVMDSMSLGEYGASAVRVGELDLAERLLQDARWRFPDQRSTILANQSVLWATKASRFMVARRLPEAEPWLKMAMDVIDEMPPAVNRKQVDSYRTTKAMVLGLHGEFELMRGDNGKAAEYFSAAYRVEPNGKMSGRWKDLGARLRSRMFGTGTY
jgi:tetratricopeptide (TPR) repeat protein